MNTRSQKSARVIRWCILAASTIFFLFLSHFISEHAICPIGGFELFFNGLFASGFSLAGLFSGMVITFLIMSLLSIVFRRAYCGYICPLGALQELFERVGKLVLPRKIRDARVPPKVDRALRWVKYLVLAAFVALAAILGGHWMIPGDPFIVLMNLGRGGDLGAVVASLPYALAFLVAILVFAFFFGRGFCKYICPAGAWYALLSKASPNKVVRDEKSCVGCGLCSKACPMNIDVARIKKVDSAECIGCHECVNACPTTGALSFPIGKLDVPAAVVPVVTAAVFAGSVYLASSTIPARGGEQGGHQGGAQWHKGGQNPNQPGKVGFGGCPNCNGCGLCITALRS
jgi:polyferredoxin